MDHKHSMELFKRAKDAIPGGVNSPVRAFGSVKKDFPVFIKKAKGSKLYDEDGNEYIDCLGSWGPMILGHNDERIVAAVKEEIENGSTFGLPTGKEVELAELIKECYPSIDKVRLTTSGTEATMAAIRVARAFTKKNKIIKFEGCYHGHSDSLLVNAGSGLLTLGHQDSNGITEGVMQDTITLPFGDTEKVREAFKNSDDISCIILEPIPGNMGLILTEKEYLEDLRKICDENNALLIFDEVISGFRAALGGAQELYGITPDITTLGKIIGGGYPVGAFGGKKEIMDMIAPVGDVYHAGTLSGNPISVRAGIETVRILKDEKDFYKNLNGKTFDLIEKMRKKIKEYSAEITINHMGSLFTIFFAGNEIKTLEDVKATSDEMFIEYFNTMLENGIIVPPSKYEAHFVSNAHSQEDMDKMLSAFVSFLEKTRCE